jgi:hypothetical protein
MASHLEAAFVIILSVHELWIPAIVVLSVPLLQEAGLFRGQFV